MGARGAFTSSTGICVKAGSPYLVLGFRASRSRCSCSLFCWLQAPALTSAIPFRHCPGGALPHSVGRQFFQLYHRFAFVIGIIVLSSWIFVTANAILLLTRGAPWRHFYPWLLLSIYALSSGLITAIGRVGLESNKHFQIATLFSVFSFTSALSEPPSRSIATPGDQVELLGGADF